MPDITFDYPFDPTGTIASNKITGEKHVVSPPAWKDYHFIVPKMAPYFRDSLVVRSLPSGDELVEGVDYIQTHLFHDASLAVGKGVYGSITFYDKERAGVIEIEYQTIGGEWTIDSNKALEIVTNNHVNPRITTWEQVVELPRQFPVIDHEWHLDDMVGMSEVEEAIRRISDVLLLSGDPDLPINDHIARRDNPHNTTKAHVGLGQVDNYATATQEEAELGEATNRFMTPRRTAQAIASLAHSYTDDHEDRDDNPHKVTKSQVGLSAVQNYPVPTQTEAEEGTSNERYMTPLRTVQAIQHHIGNDFEEHLEDYENPHRTTKDHVGLSEVENYGVATETDARLGAADNLYMTPLKTRYAIMEIANQSAGAHAEDKDNPHEVTIEQVGGYSQADIDQMLEDLVNRDVTAEDARRFGGLTPEEWTEALGGGGGDIALLLDLLIERYELALLKIDNFTAPPVENAVGDILLTEIYAGYRSAAYHYSDGSVTVETFGDGDFDTSSLDLTSANAFALGVGAGYLVNNEGVVNYSGEDSFPPPDDLVNHYVVNVWAARDYVVALLDDESVVAWGRSTKASIWEQLNGAYGEDVEKVALGYGDNGILLRTNGDITAFGHNGFRTNANAVFSGFTKMVQDMVIGSDRFLVLFDDDTIRAWEVVDPNGAGTVNELTLPEDLRRGVDIAGWSDVFGIVNETGYMYLWGRDDVDIESEEWGMIETSALGHRVIVAGDVYGETHLAEYV